MLCVCSDNLGTVSSHCFQCLRSLGVLFSPMHDIRSVFTANNFHHIVSVQGQHENKYFSVSHALMTLKTPMLGIWSDSYPIELHWFVSLYDWNVRRKYSCFVFFCMKSRFDLSARCGNHWVCALQLRPMTFANQPCWVQDDAHFHTHTHTHAHSGSWRPSTRNAWEGCGGGVSSPQQYHFPSCVAINYRTTHRNASAKLPQVDTSAKHPRKTDFCFKGFNKTLNQVLYTTSCV